MARPLHYEEPHAIWHVTSHSVDEGVIVRNDRDRRTFLEIVAETVLRFRWKVIAACVLDNHFHLVVITPHANLAPGMQFLKGTYAQGFNRRHGRRGALWRERYRRKRIRTDSHLLLTVRYVAMNGVDAGIVRSPRDDRWSSYPGVIGAAPGWPYIARTDLLSFFGTAKTALRRLIAFVEGPRTPAERTSEKFEPP